MKMNPFTVEEMNLLAIYNGESKEEVTEKIAFALSFMDSDICGSLQSARSKR